MKKYLFLLLLLIPITVFAQDMLRGRGTIRVLPAWKYQGDYLVPRQDTIVGTSTLDAVFGTLNAATTTLQATGTNPILTVIQSGTGAGMVVTGGNVGIGTTTPAARLQTTADTEQLRIAYASDPTKYSSFTVNSSGNLNIVSSGGKTGIGTTTPYSVLSVSTSTQSAPTTKLFTVASTTGDTLFTVLGSGRVGLSTTTPSARLSVSSLSQSSTPLFQVASTTNALLFQVASTGDVKMANNNWFKTIGASTTIANNEINIFKASTSDQVLLGTSMKVTSINDGLVGAWSLAEEDETTGSDLVDGWDFEDGWSQLQINSLTSTSFISDGGLQGQVYKSLTTSGKRYSMHIAGTVSVGNLIINSVGGATHKTITDSSFDESFQFIGGADARISIKTSAGGATVNITSMQLYELQTPDLTPNSNDGAIYASSTGDIFTTDRKGQPNKAMEFNGVDEKVDTGTDMIGTGSTTISAWIYLDSWCDNLGSNNNRIIDNGEVGFGTLCTGGRMEFRSDGSTQALSAVSSVTLSQWHHVVATRNATGTANFYINGILSGSADQASGPPTAGTTNIIIGDNDGDTRTFDGKISDVKIYNRVLSAEEVSGLYDEYNPGLEVGTLTVTENTESLRLVNLSVTSALAQGSSTIITFAHDNSDLMTLYAESDGAGGVQNQRVGIGSTTPQALLSLQGTTEQMRIGYDSANYAQFTVDSSGDLTIDPTGGDIIFDSTLTLATTTINATGTLTALTVRQAGSGDIFNLFSGTSEAVTVLANGSMGIGTTTPYSVLSVSTSTQSAPTTKLFTVASTTGDILLTVLGSGNVGIGETAPETLTEWSATAPYLTLHNTTAEDTSGGRESKILFKGEQSGGEETTLGSIAISHSGSGDDQKGTFDLNINKGSDGDSPTNVLSVYESGNVAIFDITLGSILLDADRSIFGAAIDGNRGFISPYNSATGDFELGTTFGTADVAFTAGGAEKMRIMSTGNVGIGTTTPTGKLTIKADANDNVLRLIENSGDEFYDMEVDSAGDLKFVNDGGFTSFEVTDGGSLYMGSNLGHFGDLDTLMAYTGDQIQWAVGGEILLKLTEGAQDEVDIGNGGDVDINLNDNMFVQGSTGFVGIGTTTPTSLLDVHSTGTTTTVIDSDSLTQGGCFCLAELDGAGYTCQFAPGDGTITTKQYATKALANACE